MDLIWLALVIQTVFFIVKNAHYAIIIFIILSLILTYLKMNKLVSIILPMICAHIAFLYLSTEIESFYRKRKRKRKFKRKKAFKRIKKNLNVKTVGRLSKMATSAASNLLNCGKDKKEAEKILSKTKHILDEHKKDIEANNEAIKALS